MSLETFKIIADKIKEQGLQIGAMFCFGEPLTDPTLFEKYEYANKIGVLTPGHVGLNTNVSLLTAEKYPKILAHTPNIILSFFNVGDEYTRLTGGLDWNNSYKNAINFIKYRDEHKPEYSISIGCNKIVGSNLEAVKEAFKGYNVKFVQDAEIRLGRKVITGLIDRMITFNRWRCDGYKGALQIKWNGDCEFCAYDIIEGETKFGNILEDSWDKLESKFKAKWRAGCSLCRRCDYWHKAKEVMKNGCKKPNPLPADWYDWQKPYGENGVD